MQIQFMPATNRVERPAFVWLAVVLEIATGIMAIPVGWWFIGDPSGKVMGLPGGWIEATPFGSYLIPGIYLFAMNGLGMLLLAALTVRWHWTAPWLTGVLGVGLIIWILVQLAVMPETMILQWIFLATGIALGFVALFWLRRTGQLRLW
ncbi:MAG TPA: hypothetical protein VFO73_00880 [Candidatus Limnocylindrales bacterium]|nr:hypothetical protein [Candidatus Limnocylindrales bacterium]